MRLLRHLAGRHGPTACFCDGCARVRACDATAEFERMRDRVLQRYSGIGLR
jgi:hypothetical protein